MKTYNEEHDVIIESQWFPTPDKKTIHDGDIVPHHQTVSNIYFFQPHHTKNGIVYTRVDIHKNMLINLVAQIEKIESESKDMELTDIPF